MECLKVRKQHSWYEARRMDYKMGWGTLQQRMEKQFVDMAGCVVELIITYCVATHNQSDFIAMGVAAAAGATPVATVAASATLRSFCQHKAIAVLNRPVASTNS